MSEMKLFIIVYYYMITLKNIINYYWPKFINNSTSLFTI